MTSCVYNKYKQQLFLILLLLLWPLPQFELFTVKYLLQVSGQNKCLGQWWLDGSLAGSVCSLGSWPVWGQTLLPQLSPTCHTHDWHSLTHYFTRYVTHGSKVVTRNLLVLCIEITVSHYYLFYLSRINFINAISDVFQGILTSVCKQKILWWWNISLIEERITAFYTNKRSRI